mgnify:CR=1 FL=1
MKKGISVIYLSANQLFEALADHAYSREEAGQEEYYHWVLDSDLLILDDCGTEVSNTFTVSRLFQLLNERALLRKSTIISTNLTLDRFAETYSERTFSRISSNYTIIKLFGNDIRIRNLEWEHDHESKKRRKF